MRNLFAAFLVAGALAALLLTVTLGGKDWWKFVLAAAGLALWVLGGLSKNPDQVPPAMDKNVARKV